MKTREMIFYYLILSRIRISRTQVVSGSGSKSLEMIRIRNTGRITLRHDGTKRKVNVLFIRGGSGSLSRTRVVSGSKPLPDPDPYKNDTDPQHWPYHDETKGKLMFDSTQLKQRGEKENSFMMKIRVSRYHLSLQRERQRDTDKEKDRDILTKRKTERY